jgi:hypothetical protein
MFLSLLTRHRIENDQIFDWMIPKKNRAKYLKDIKRKFKLSSHQENDSSALDESNALSHSGMNDKSSVSDSVSQGANPLGMSSQSRPCANENLSSIRKTIDRQLVE